MSNKEKDYQKECSKLTRNLGAARKKIENLQTQLEGELAKGKAYEQLQDINLAMITAIVRKLGEVKISQTEINEVLDEHIHCNVGYNAETLEYILGVPEEAEEE